MEELARSREIIRRIVARTNLDDFTEEVLASFWARPEYQRFRPAPDDIRAWVRWNIDLVIRWLVDGRPPTEAEIEVLRERARSRAAAGMPADVVPANFRRGARFAWNAMLAAAREDERPALLESAGLLFEYIDRVSELFSDTYGAEGAAVVVSDEERRARTLLARLTSGEELVGEDHQLAERMGFAVRSVYRPFVLVAPGQAAQRHAAIAAQLRERGVLATAEGPRVVGLADAPVPASEWSAVYAQGDRTGRDDLPHLLDDLRGAVEIAVADGRSGPVAVDDYLPELLLRRSPRLAARIRRRVYGPLDDELARTLDLLIQNGFDRGRTAADLPVHRNTLTNRLARIEALTGVDVDRVGGRELAWLAWLERGGRPASDPVSPGPVQTTDSTTVNYAEALTNNS